MENFTPDKEKHLRWKNAILKEREVWKVDPKSLLAFAITKYLEKFDNALILGDACQVESQYLGEIVGFAHIDNVDSSPLVMDHYYNSEKMTPILSSFEALQIPENTYDFVHGKSVTFIEKNKLTEFLEKVKQGLRIGGIFSSIWFLSRNSIMSQDNWEKSDLMKIIQESGLELIYEKEIEGESINLHSKRMNRHELCIILKKTSC